MGLLNYLLSRIGSYFVVLFVGLTITFFLPRFLPSDPIENYIVQLEQQAGQSMTPEEMESIRETLQQIYGLEGSLFEQYLGYLGRVVLRFDFGPSLANFPTPVNELILKALPWTIGLMGTAVLVSWVLGNLIGLVAGYFHESRVATGLEVLGVILYPIPPFIVALVLIMLFGYVWPIFPLSTTIRPGPLTAEKMRTILYFSFLPALSLILTRLGWNLLSMKAVSFSIREEAYVTYARLKGTPSRTIVGDYVFKNSILPQITRLALTLGAIFSGTVLIEILFSYPGLGLLMRTASGTGDYNLLYGTIVITIVAVATAALAIDLLYPLFDPRIRLR
jgi:peptide/nickel transport system permease protein